MPEDYLRFLSRFQQSNTPCMQLQLLSNNSIFHGGASSINRDWLNLLMAWLSNFIHTKLRDVIIHLDSSFSGGLNKLQFK